MIKFVIVPTKKLTQDAVLLNRLVVVGKVVVYHFRSILLLKPRLDMPLINLISFRNHNMTFLSCAG